MEGILKESIKWKKFELLINTKIFSQDIALDAAYGFLDKGYFFFDLDKEENLILQFTAKTGVVQDPEEIIWEFSDELLNMTLRHKLEKENKILREAIVEKAINGPLDLQNFVSLDTSSKEEGFDKDLKEIFSYIENETSFDIDDEEVENILKEIDKNSKSKK